MIGGVCASLGQRPFQVLVSASGRAVGGGAIVNAGTVVRALDRGGLLTCVVDGQRTLAGVIIQTDAESEQPFGLSGEDRVARAAGPVEALVTLVDS